MLALGAAVVLSGCNPLVTDPTSLGGELELTSGRYQGPAGAWIEVSVRGASDHDVFALALIRTENLEGPTMRSCAGPGGSAVDCVVTPGDVRMPNQRVVPGDGLSYVRLMTVWSGEPVEIVLVCVDPDTQELGCPAAMRTALRTVDHAETLIGDLTPVT